MFNKKIIIPLGIVIVLLLVLLGVSMLGGNNSNEINSSGPQNEDYTVNYIFNFNTDTVSRIRVNLPSESFTFSKNDGVWILADNPNTSISTGTVNSLVSAISNLSYDEVINDGSITSEDCGINSDSPSVTFVSELGEVTVKMGMTTTDGKLCYVITSLSDDVYLADCESASSVFAPLKAYRNSAALSLDFENIVSIEYSGIEKLSLVKSGANKDNARFNQWEITSPISIWANDEFVNNKIIEPLKQIKIEDFASDNGDFSSFGLGGKNKFVSLADNSGKKQTVYFSSSTKGKYYISIDNKKAIYEVSPSDSPYLALKIIDLADRNISLAKMVNIKNVTISGANYNYNVEFSDKSGKINGKEINYTDLNQNIFPALCGIMADDIYTGPIGSTEITMTFNYKETKSDVIIFASHNDRYYAVSKNGSVKYLILKNKIADLANLLNQYK